MAARQTSLEKNGRAGKRNVQKKKIPLNFGFKESSHPVPTYRFLKRTGPRQTWPLLLAPKSNQQLKDYTQEIILLHRGQYAQTHVRGIAINTRFSMLRTSVWIQRTAGEELKHRSVIPFANSCKPWNTKWIFLWAKSIEQSIENRFCLQKSHEVWL